METKEKALLYKIKTSCSFYIGSTKNSKKRFAEHLNDLKRGIHHCLPLQEEYNRDPTIDIIILFEGSLSDSRELEQLILDSWYDCILNISKSSKGCSPIYYTDRREEISRRLLNRPKEPKLASEETKNKMRLIRKGATIPKKCIDRSKEKLSRPVVKKDLEGNVIDTYKSISEAGATFKKLGEKNISKALNGKQKTAYGYVWEYLPVKIEEEKVFNKRYLHCFITRYKTVSVKFNVDGVIHFLGTFDSQKEAIDAKNKFLISNKLTDKIKLIEYEGE